MLIFSLINAEAINQESIKKKNNSSDVIEFLERIERFQKESHMKEKPDLKQTTLNNTRL